MAFSFNSDVRDQLEQMVGNPDFKVLTQLPVFAPMEIGLGVLAYILFISGTWFYLTDVVSFPVMLAINSFAIYLSFTPLHDATHRTVSSSRRVNDAVGTICCLLLLPGITTRIYRYLHLEHHRYAGDPERDPDEPFVSAPAWQLPFVLAFLDILWVTWYLRHWQTRPTKERLEFSLGILFYLGLHVGFLTSPYAIEFLSCWVIPQRLGLFYVSWFFAHIQHPEGMEWETAPLQTTYKVKTGWLADKLLLGQATHCIHHLAPSVPYYRYARAWQIGKEIFEGSVPTRTLWRDSVQPPQATNSSASAATNTVQNKRFEVQIASTGDVLEVQADDTLLDVLQENGYPVMCSCTQGVCGSCLTPVLEGIPEHRDAILSEADKAANDCMTVCVSRAKSERLILDL